MNTRLPAMAVLLGIAGLIPFVGCGLAAVSTTDDQAFRAMAALLAYGAAVLAFLGGVHWGFVLAPRPVLAAGASTVTARLGHDNLRLALGVLPSLVGWAALLAAVVASQTAALAVLIVGFLATLITEWQMRRSEVIPTGYMVLRWVLSLIVLITLITVMTLHLLGAKIIL